MRKLVVTEFVTLDGVMEDPGGGEAFERGGWAFQFERGEEGDRFKLDELMASDVLLLGRRTYEGFAPVWTTMSGDPFSDHINAMEKWVVSTTLTDPTWNNTTVLPDLDAVAELKQRAEGDILVAGSAQLHHGLVERGLVDEWRLMVFPVLLGSGKRLFGEAADLTGLELVDSRQLASGSLYLTYLAVSA
jgi:dihydrofolate reductase